MDPQNLLEQHLNEIIDIARFAPSLYNTQPWRVHQNGNNLIITIDSRYQLVNADPIMRQTYIGLGIFCEAIGRTAQNFGLAQSSVTLDAGQAILTFTNTQTIEQSAEIAAIKSRSSDRGMYAHIDIPHETIQAIISSAAGLDVTVKVITDPTTIATVADLNSQGKAQALNNAQFRNELRRYLIPLWSSNKRGIPIKSLGLSPFAALLKPWHLKHGMGIDSEVAQEKKLWESASAVILFRADEDVMKSWYEVGQAFMRVSLAIEKLGLSLATSEAIVEISQFHEDLQNLLFTKQRILAIMRIGQGKGSYAPSPRVDASELIT